MSPWQFQNENAYSQRDEMGQRNFMSLAHGIDENGRPRPFSRPYNYPYRPRILQEKQDKEKEETQKADVLLLKVQVLEGKIGELKPKNKQLMKELKQQKSENRELKEENKLLKEENKLLMKELEIAKQQVARLKKEVGHVVSISDQNTCPNATPVSQRSLGITLDGKTCKRCKNEKGFCHQHIAQDSGGATKEPVDSTVHVLGQEVERLALAG